MHTSVSILFFFTLLFCCVTATFALSHIESRPPPQLLSSLQQQQQHVVVDKSRDSSKSKSYPPGFYQAWSYGRIWWEINTSIYQDYIGHFDNSGTAFSVLSVGGGSMNLTGLGVEMMIATTAENHTKNEPHVFGAFLFEYDSVDQLPPTATRLVPPLENATRSRNFTTAEWKSGVRYQENIFSIADPSKTYVMWLIKLTEADWNRRFPKDNYVTFISFVLDRNLPRRDDEVMSETTTSSTSLRITARSNTSMQTSSSSPIRRIEFLGDSITAGYCNVNTQNKTANGTNATFTTYANESYVKTWDFLLAQSLQAEYNTVAWSGMGLVRNYGGTGTVHFPDIYQRTCASVNEPGKFPWPFPGDTKPTTNATKHVQGLFLPQVVVFNLGTNDFAEVDPNSTEFKTICENYVIALKSFVSNLGLYYGDVLRPDYSIPLYLFLACGPMTDVYCPLLKTVEEWWNGLRKHHLVQIEVVKFPELEEQHRSCGHPNIIGDQIMARYAERIVRKVTGWKN